MRCSQPYGLPLDAQLFLEKNESVVRCEHCNSILKYDREVLGNCGMFDDVPILRYNLKDGRTADEFLQYSPWSSGPMLFFALVVSDGTVFRWTKEDAEEACGEPFWCEGCDFLERAGF